ncbi:MAG: DUF192 domain-containing protein [Gammaproteobacteria bacterium]|nr:DUF192 domain-containing protein [Gammaproteobacteria bacterium]
MSTAKQILSTVFCLLMAACSEQADPYLRDWKEQGQLEVLSADDRAHRFEVYLATTPKQHSQGLMYVRDLDQFQGMLFLLEQPEDLGIWMKNTYIPLDILFIDEHQKIVYIEKQTVPGSTRLISSGQKVMAILELNAGVADQLSIAVGDVVKY